jgi:DNA-binding transcriptional MerR regulator
MQLLNTRVQQVEWRRDRVLELSSQGFSQSDIATVLQVDKSIISRDVAHFKRQAQDNLQHHIHETIPAEYEKAMNSLNQVLRYTWTIAGKTADEKTRLQALTLITECNKYKIDLATNGTIVSDALKGIQSKIDHINGNGNGKADRNTDINNRQIEKAEPEPETKDNTVF